MNIHLLHAKLLCGSAILPELQPQKTMHVLLSIVRGNCCSSWCCTYGLVFYKGVGVVQRDWSFFSQVSLAI